jgi:hypothetical protein
MLLKLVSFTKPAMVWFAMNAPDESAADGRQVKVTRIAVMRDEKAALVDDQRRGGVRLQR